MSQKRLTIAREQAREPYAQRNIARRQIETARDALRTHDILTNWQYLPEHLSAAEARIEALDTWHDWAVGGVISKHLIPERLSRMFGQRDSGVMLG